MTNPTSNYSWQMPTATDLVTDLPADFEVFGQAVDTTTKNLNPSTTLGDVEYRSATANTNTRLGIGSTGQVLTVAAGVPSWATPTSGGMTLISTTTLTGASVTISSIPATYNDLILNIVNFIPATDGSRLLLRMNADATANRHSTSASGAFGSTSFDFFENQDNAVSQSLWRVWLPNYANTTTWKLASNTGISNNETTSTNFAAISFSLGKYNQTAAISSLQLFANSGNLTSGTVLLYGVK